MARSLLLNALQRLASEHAEAAARGVEISRVRDERARMPIGRRAFLAGGGALAGAALMQPRPSKAAGTPRIAIVGAGIAGLNAALTLQDAGFSSTIYEATSRVGGRMHSDTTSWAESQTSEWCGEFIDSDHATIIQLAQRFRLPLIDTIAAQPAGTLDTLYFLGKRYSLDDADRDFQPVFATLQGQVVDYPTLYNSVTRLGEQLDDLSVYAWIERYVPGGHRSQLGQYLDSAYCQEYGLDTHQQSSLNLVYALGFQPASTPTPTFAIYGQSDQRYRIGGGNGRLPQAIAASLPQGSIEAGCRLTMIERSPVGGFNLRFTDGGGERTVGADHVILALPFSVLRLIDFERAGFDPLKRVAINELGYGTNSKLMLQFDRRVWNSIGADGNIYTDLFFQNTWEASRGSPGADGVLVAYTGGQNGASFSAAAAPYASAATDPAVRTYAQEVLSEIDVVWPGLSRHWNGRATLSTPWRDPNQLGSYSCWKVGQYTKFAGYEGVRQGNCHFAGEHCSTGFQGFMEGAAEEGARAAGEILGDYHAAALR